MSVNIFYSSTVVKNGSSWKSSTFVYNLFVGEVIDESSSLKSCGI